MSETLSTTFMAIAEAARVLKAAPIKDKIWELRLDKHWEFAVNGHATKQKVTLGSGVQHEVEPYHAYVEFNGWPAGVFSPYGGSFAAGELANEKAFCAALQRYVKERCCG